MAQFKFEAANVSPDTQFAPVPNGEYPVVITESEMKDTKDGAGQYLQLVLEIIDGHYKGRKIWDRLNLVNKNATAVEIAQRALSQICHAINHLSLQDTAELHHKPLLARVVVRPAGGGYDESNEVKEYKAMSGPVPAPAPLQAPPGYAQQPAAPAAPAAQVGNKPAWA